MQVYKNYLSKDNVTVKFDDNTVHSYPNTARGRAQLEAECTTEIVETVYRVWGDTPTVEKEVFPEIPKITTPTATEQLRADVDYLSTMMGVTLS